MTPWLFPLLMLPAIGFWAWLYFSPLRRRSLRHCLGRPDDPDEPLQSDPEEGLPAVAILCPGRNEAEHLPRTLPPICEQDYPGDLRVIFIDDESDDGTPEITAEMAERYDRLEVVRNTEPPRDGWVGKCWAIEQGMKRLAELEEAGEGPYRFVCMTDADIDWDRSALRQAMRLEAATGADVVGLLPELESSLVTERLAMSAMVLGIGIILPLERAMDPRSPWTVISGAFICVRRSLYEGVGRHSAVRNKIIEDIGLGEVLKARGGRMRLVRAQGLLNCEMYESWSDLWEGLTKNAYAGLLYNPWLTAGFAMATVALNIAPVLCLIAGAVAVAAGAGWPVALGTAAAALVVFLQVRMTGKATQAIGLPPIYRWALPVSSALYLLLIAGSMWRYYRGGNVWKGRSYGGSDLQPLDAD